MRTILIAAAILSGTAVGAQTPTPSFCERLAPQLGMKQKIGTRNAEPSWEVNILGGMKTFLLGGSAMVGFDVTPLGEPTVADYQRLKKVCAMTGKEVVCGVSEPLRLSVQIKERVAEVEALPGEKATVATKGSRVNCRNS